MPFKIKIPARVQLAQPVIAKPMAAKKSKSKSSKSAVGAPYPIGVMSTFDPEGSMSTDAEEAGESARVQSDADPDYESVTKSEDTTVDEGTTTIEEDETDSTKDDAMEKDGCSTPMSASISILSPNRNLIWPEFQIENCRTESTFGHFVVPIITLGLWDHPYYGEVTFTQNDIDELSNNFDNRAAGYEPALYVGHGSPFDGGGRPAAGFLEVLVQNEDVLWGIYAAVDEEVYMQVKRGQYRYSSAELTQDTVHRQSGDKLGLVLTGCALTNEPFLTNMPPVRVFHNQKSTQQPLAIAYALNHHSCVLDRSDFSAADSTSKPVKPVREKATSTNMSTAPVSNVESNTGMGDSVPQNLSGSAVKLSNPALTVDTTILAISAELKELKSEFSLVKTQLVELTAANKNLELARATEIKERQFATVRDAALSAGAKQAFMTALSSPTIDADTAAALITQVKELSNNEAVTYLSQHGTSVVEPQQPNVQVGAPAAAAAAKQEFAYGAYLADRAARMQAK